MRDITYYDEITHFDRERAPERVVHARGAGAFGYFEVTHDITRYTRMCIFNKVGKRTPMAARFSMVTPESGSADTVRDPRGFALKFYTEEGIWDLVCNNTPIFFIRDPILFPSFIHSQKRNPATHMKDPNMFWDFVTHRPETVHQITWLFGDRGIPDGYRHMNGYSGHAFKLINAKGEAIYAKFHFHSNQGVKNLSSAQAMELCGTEPNYAIKDLYNAIEDTDSPPAWTLSIQVMAVEQADACPFNAFDITKVWPHGDYPLFPVGRMVLTRNSANYFAEVEQMAFSPHRLIPGIDVSPDKMLQGRLISYDDAQRHRLGANYMQIPVNCPFKTRTYHRDGLPTVCDNYRDTPNYFPNSFCGPRQHCEYNEPAHVEKPDEHGQIVSKRYDSRDEDNFTQCGAFWRQVLTEDERVRLIQNMASHLKDAEEWIQDKAVLNFAQCDVEYGRRLRVSLDQLNKEAFELKRLRFSKHVSE
jgi:catalase